MKIAITSDQPGLDGRVPALFSESPWLVIIETDSGEALCSLAGSEAPLHFAKEILRWNCEGLLSGPIEREPFLLIADEGGVTRYDAAGLSVREALSRLESRSLELIRDHIGDRSCDSRRSGGSQCREHH
ncbi:MAG: hypothetical protein LBV79_01670 [Candidatus Adiutrix sp.]|jgi:predicted Fe-Mo cluster-binding NifX family protein|nr:hypothetical protein [Candidatus Adiutrix sp.]